MKRPPKWKRFWLCCRWGIRGCRVALLLILLALVAGFIWFNQIGMPDFAKTLLRNELMQRGLDVEFQHMSWKWFQGIVTEDLVAHPAAGRIGPSIRIRSADVDLDLNRLVTGELSVKAIKLFQGSGRWRVHPTNEPPRTLDISHLNTEIRFLPGDRWELARFDAVVQGVQISAAGKIAHASFAGGAKRPGSAGGAKQKTERRAAMERAERQIHRALAAFSRLRFADAPRLRVDFDADARRRGEIDARVSGNVDMFEGAGIEGKGVAISGQVSRTAETNAPIKASLSLSADTIVGHSVRGQGARGFAFVSLTPAGRWSALWNAGFKRLVSPWATAVSATLEGNIVPDPRDPTNQLATVSAAFESVNLGRDRVGDTRLTASLEGNLRARQLARAEVRGAAADLHHGRTAVDRLAFDVAAHASAESAATNLHGWHVTTDLDATGVRHGPLRIPRADTRLEWHSPQLVLHQSRFEFSDGPVTLEATADLGTRDVLLRLKSAIQLQQIAPLLGPKTEEYLAQYRFRSAPAIDAAAAICLPSGDLKSLDWNRDLAPLLSVAGRIEAEAGDYRGLAFDRAHTDIRLTNNVLTLPNLRVERPEGRADLTYTNHLVTRDYSFGIDSGINPLAIGPLLGEGERQGLEFLSINREMPRLHGTLFGRWGDLDRTGFDAVARMTNIAIRGQGFDRLLARASMTNGLLVIRDAELERPEGRLTTPILWVDTEAGRVWLSNVVSGIDFMVIPEIIGPLTARAVRPYEFPIAPSVVINGSVGTDRDAEKWSDLHFDLRASHFHWFKFNLTNVTARLDWVTNRLSVTNLQSGFHGGRLDGWLGFDFDPPVGNDFAFDLAFTNAGLRSLIADIANPTNSLEGDLTGRIRVTDANTEYWESWQGHGEVALTDGLLWDIPVFGIFSPVLNTLIPGLGRSKATRAEGAFTMTNSLIRTRDLIIHSPPARLYYDGTVDFDANVDARVEAKLFKNKSLVGKLFDALTAPITKIFEYKVNGTLGHPVTKPINELPKLLLAPLKPLQAVGEILKGGSRPKEKPDAPDRPD